MTIIPLRYWIAVLILGMIVLNSCAEDRFLTKEEDAEMREACQQGCIAVPYPQWLLIKRALGLTDL